MSIIHEFTKVIPCNKEFVFILKEVHIPIGKETGICLLQLLEDYQQRNELEYACYSFLTSPPCYGAWT